MVNFSNSLVSALSPKAEVLYKN